MAMLKVILIALAGGVLFAGSAMSILEGIEKSVGRGSTVVVIGIGCVGALLGAIASAAQVIVDAIRESK